MRSHLSAYGLTMLGGTVGLAAAWGILVLADAADHAVTGATGPASVQHVWPAVGWALQTLTVLSAVWLVSVRGSRGRRPWFAAGLALVLLAAWTAAALCAPTGDNLVLPWQGHDSQSSPASSMPRGP